MTQKTISIAWYEQSNILCIRRKIPRKDLVLVTPNMTLERLESLIAFMVGRNHVSIITLDGMFVQNTNELVDHGIYRIV